MSNKPIAAMNYKELRNEVQLLRDELSIMQRKYEDTINNLDSSNFCKNYLIEQNGLKTQVKITAKAIETMVSDTDLTKALEKYSTITQTAEKIESAVGRVTVDTDGKLKNYSTISQTADKIESAVVRVTVDTDGKLENYSKISQTADMIKGTVTKEYVDTLIGDTYVTNAVLYSEIQQSADGIYMTVSANYDELDSKISNVENFKESVFTQTAYGFTLDGEQTTFTGVIYLTDTFDEKRFSIFYDTSQGFEQVLMHSTVSDNIKLILGDSDGTVYIGNYSSGNEVATRGWVQENAVARFG